MEHGLLLGGLRLCSLTGILAKVDCSLSYITVIRVLAHTEKVGCDDMMYALYRYVHGSWYVIDCHISGALLKIPWCG